MKFLACGDLHITDKMPYGNERKEELISAWQQMISYASQNNIEWIIITGDVFDDINVSPASFEIFRKMIDRTFNMKFIICSGNHEIDEAGNSVVKILCNFFRDKELYAPLSYDRERVVTISNDTDILLFDYHHSHAELKISMRECLRESDGERKIFVGHQPVEGMEMRDSVLCTHGIPKKWFTKKGIIGKNFDLVLMGDFHRMQPITGDIEAYYTGSLIQHSFRDEGGTPSFFEVNLDGKQGIEVKHISVDCPLFHTIKYVEGKSEPDQKHISQGAYIRITITGTKEYIESLNIDSIKEKMIESKKPKKIFLSNPTITCSIPKTSKQVVSRLMTDEELVGKIISEDKNKLPDKLLYDVGVKYLRRAKG